MNRETHLLVESIQEITLYAWPIVWNNNKYDQDSRVVLEMLRNWGEEFETWWIMHNEKWMDEHDYVGEVQAFADTKSKEYIKQFENLETTKEHALTPLQSQVIADALRDRIGKLYNIAEMYTDNPIAKKDCYNEAKIVRKVLDEFLAI